MSSEEHAGHCSAPNHPMRILHIVGAMYPGGVENFIMNLYRHIDRERFQFDFIVHQRRENDYVPEIEAMGGRVYELPRLTKHPVTNLREITQLTRENGYAFVIRHTANALIAPQLLAAKRGGAVTICHSHSSDDPQVRLHRIGQRLLPKAADFRFACSEQAGKWMYGETGTFQIIRNAVDLSLFSYTKEKGERVRAELGIAGRHVYGHVGNYIEVKNHPYLLKVYREIVNREPDAVCLCVGEGELRGQIEAQVRELGLTKNVILTGLRKDIPDILSALDVLIFPSIFEGLPLTLIEAQAAGLPMLISDAITEDVVVTEGLVERRPISEDPALWAERAIALANGGIEGDADAVGGAGSGAAAADLGIDCICQERSRTCQRERIAAAGYDLQELVQWYEVFFERCRK